MNVTRIQIHLKYFFDENSSKQFYNFWYAFEPSKLLTIRDILDDIRLNYFNNQVSLLTEENNDRSLIFHLDDCQLLPFTSSQVLRDNDRLILMPLTKYKLHKKSFQDSINLNLSSAIVIEPQPNTSETNHKRPRNDSFEQNIPLQSTITISTPVEHVQEQQRTKKIKIKSIEDEVVQLPVIQPTSEPRILQVISSALQGKTIENEGTSEAPLSLPSINGRIRELKSKTPKWKAQQPVAQGNTQDKVHVRFDSESDEEPISHPQSVIEEEKTVEPLTNINNSNNLVSLQSVPIPVPIDVVKKPEQSKPKKKTIDLLFEMKQHKTPDDKNGKTIQQQFGRKRAHHKKRALDYFSMANFVDQAFGLDKTELEKQISSNGYHTSSSSPQTLPTSFNKLARLPLVVEVIEDNDKIYDLYPPITQCPAIQTRIAFKSLELSEDFCPKMSVFKEGTVIDVDQTSNELTIQLDQPLPTVFNQPSKFFAPIDELLEEDTTTIILPFSDLYSVRLLPALNETTAS